jgi:hypothetical protein
VVIDPYGNGTLPYNTPAGEIQKFLRKTIVGFEDVEVTLSHPYSCEYSCSWFIKYKNYNQPVTSVLPSASGLSGSAAPPTLIWRTRRNYSSHVLFNPVDYRFLSTPSADPSVVVYTNGAPSVCAGNCAYNFALYSEVTSLSRNGTVLDFAISDPTSLNFTASQVRVTVQGQACIVDTSKPISGLTCQLPTNNDSSLALVASNSVTPIVWVGNYGIAGLSNTTSPFSVPLVVNPLSVSQGGRNGGYYITITGTGFPSEASKIAITLCGAAATVKSTTSTQASFYVPSCSSNGPQTLNVTVNGVTDSSRSFEYIDPSNAPTIISLSPSSANPGIKGVLEINGYNFGTNISSIKVFLSNSTGKVYQLSVLTITNTSIKVGLSGGLPGTFTVQVNDVARGDSIPANATDGSDRFTYKVSVISVSPTTGSINGGTLLTISGENFATEAQQTLVFIGDTANWFCSV